MSDILRARVSDEFVADEKRERERQFHFELRVSSEEDQIKSAKAD